MTDQITNCVQQNDADGNPLWYDFFYLLDDGNGNQTAQDFCVTAVKGLTIDQATDTANTMAAAFKSNWLISLQSLGAVQLPNVAGPVTL